MHKMPPALTAATVSLLLGTGISCCRLALLPAATAAFKCIFAKHQRMALLMQGMDALTHAVEAYVSTISTPLTGE